MERERAQSKPEEFRRDLKHADSDDSAKDLDFKVLSVSPAEEKSSRDEPASSKDSYGFVMCVCHQRNLATSHSHCFFLS